MAQIKLEFTTANVRDSLLADDLLLAEITRLNPVQRNDTFLILHDNNTENSDLDSEIVILQPFVNALSRIIFPNSPFSIQYINPSTTQFKLGLLHDFEIIIKSSIIINNQI